MQVSAELPLRHAFVLDAKDVHDIWKTLADAVGQVEATASCADHMKRPFASAETLVAYANARARQITSLEFWAQSEDRRQNAHLSLMGESGMMSFRAQGCEPTVSRLKDQLADILDGMRPWYSSIARLDVIALMVRVLILASIVLGSIPVSKTSDGGSTTHPTSSVIALVVTISLGVIACWGGLTWGLYKLHRRFFPMGTFAIGQGHKRHRVDEWIRGGVLIGGVLFAIVIGLGISTLGSLIASKIGGSP